MTTEILGFHIEPTNICTLKCSGCARTRFISQWPQYWKNHSLNIEHLLSFLDIDLTGKLFVLCGNYGDPIYHPDFINFVARLKTRGAIVTITTNGSYKNQEWWQDLIALLDANDNVTFSIDGMPDNFTQYRHNANWDSIKIGIKECVVGTCRTTWKYIPFSYNESSIDLARQLAQELGIDQFRLVPSDRFDDQTNWLKPSDTLIGNRFPSIELWKQDRQLPVDPKCQNQKEHYISADGFYSPCCQLADHRFYYKNQFGKNKSNYNINTTTLSQILKAPATVEFYQKIGENPGCQYNCPKTTG